MGAKEPAVVGILASTPALGARDRSPRHRLLRARLSYTVSTKVGSTSRNRQQWLLAGRQVLIKGG
jgi:hypothetical protein